MRRTGRWAAGCVGVLMAAAMPEGAWAQEVDRGLRADSAGVPADTARLVPERLAGLAECRPLGYRVVDDSAAVAHLHRWPQCRGADFGDVAGRTLLGLPLFGDCRARYRIDVWRSVARREYRVRVTEHYGGCRAARGHYVWLALPKLPAGWRVGFTEERAGELRSRRALFPSRIHVVGADSAGLR